MKNYLKKINLFIIILLTYKNRNLNVIKNIMKDRKIFRIYLLNIIYDFLIIKVFFYMKNYFFEFINFIY